MKLPNTPKSKFDAAYSASSIGNAVSRGVVSALQGDHELLQL